MSSHAYTETTGSNPIVGHVRVGEQKVFLSNLMHRYAYKGKRHKAGKLRRIYDSCYKIAMALWTPMN